MSSNKNIIRVAATWLLASTILLTSSCSVVESFLGASRDDNGTLKGEAKIDIFDVQTGDCLVDFQEESDTVGKVTATPCTNKHDAEVYAVASTTTTNAANEDWAVEFCYDKFEPFFGIVYEESVIEVTYVQPQVGSKDTTVTCVAYEEGVTDSTTSLKGANR
ncbi:MAG: hypothetical protein LBM94_02340 [Propionibacteriaceae bacterium]|jgi:hypothetical protein|nr:hypothetical protein [Propionibacteriaceae bacterium]